jgi:hypothetical protein
MRSVGAAVLDRRPPTRGRVKSYRVKPNHLIGVLLNVGEHLLIERRGKLIEVTGGRLRVVILSLKELEHLSRQYTGDQG